jgi:hypothetical protein
MIGDGRITYRGIELRQDDEDVWLQILHLGLNLAKPEISAK